MKNLKYYLNLDYSIRLRENQDGTYFAEIEELPGCITEGDTKSKTLNLIEDAKKSWIKTALEEKIAIPEPFNATSAAN